jgi:methylenetetrahydrofolate--tRNA-(uracil-5-)-methyltransferase
LAKRTVHIIGAGMAGSEAAWQIAEAGMHVILHEMRPQNSTPAHKTSDFAELVCSNSFRADDAESSAIGLLHEEMRKLNSLIMKCADEHKVPAGGALAVDRTAFSQAVTEKLKLHPNISIEYGEITSIPPKEWKNVIIATGPLSSPALIDAFKNVVNSEYLSFFDAIAPIVTKDSIDMSKAWYQSRYDKGDGKDYINCPLNKEQYEEFVADLNSGEKVEFKEWEKKAQYFEGCLPIEVMAERGPETLRFGPMKPKGLTDPNNPNTKPYAVIQLRQDNKLGTLYNIVGFQTKLKYGEQTRIFKKIPGLENAEFVRLGGIHRNTFLNSPVLLDKTLRLKSHPYIRFAGQITGCEGYVESASIGLLAGLFASGKTSIPPITTAIGALLNHITTGATVETFQPMNVNFGLFPNLPKQTPIKMANGKMRKVKLKGKDRKKAHTDIARVDFDEWLKRLESKSIFESIFSFFNA